MIARVGKEHGPRSLVLLRARWSAFCPQLLAAQARVIFPQLDEPAAAYHIERYTDEQDFYPHSGVSGSGSHKSKR